MIQPFSAFYHAARQYLGKHHADDALHGVLFGDNDLNFDTLRRVQLTRTLTALDIKCDYLRQINALAAKGIISQAELAQARASVSTSTIKVSAKNIITTASEELTTLFNKPAQLSNLLSDRLLADYGLLNTVAIRLQDPTASLLFTYQQVKRLGGIVKHNQNPILLFTPTLRTYFKRDGEMIKTRDASPTEQIRLACGELPTVQNVQYMQTQFYDISQLQLSQYDRQRILDSAAPREINWDALRAFGVRLQDENGLHLQIVTGQLAGMSVKSLYDANKNVIYLMSHLNEAQQAWELTKRLSQAIFQTASNAPQPVKDFEWRLLAAQMAHKWNVAPEPSFFSEVSTTFQDAKDLVMGHLEESVCRIGNAVGFMVTQQTSVENELHPEQVQLHEHNTEPALKPEEALGNFLEGL